MKQWNQNEYSVGKGTYIDHHVIVIQEQGLSKENKQIDSDELRAYQYTYKKWLDKTALSVSWFGKQT